MYKLKNELENMSKNDSAFRENVQDQLEIRFLVLERSKRELGKVIDGVCTFLLPALLPLEFRLRAPEDRGNISPALFTLL